mmetsp:Transcript_89364/g.239032  ORF Transcript_89364/g.239032 Transcript_89364/m.239032 type:complete len:91 (+) Transcript_89364:2-274(+)
MTRGDDGTMADYGSIGQRDGYIGKEAWQARQERSRMELVEADDTKKTIRQYIVVGVVIAIVVVAVCYFLMSRVVSQLTVGMRHQHHGHST